MTLRCPICDWPMAESRDKGCMPGDCSYRPDQGSPEWYRTQQRRRDLAEAESTSKALDIIERDFR